MLTNKMRFYSFIILLITCQISFAQKGDINNRIEHLDELYKLCRETYETHPDSTIKLGKMIRDESRGKNDYYYSLGLYCIGLGHSQIDNIKYAILYLDSAQSIQLENKYYNALIQNYITNSGIYFDMILIHDRNENIELLNKAAKSGVLYSEKTIEVAKQINDTNKITKGYLNLAAFYYYLYQYEKAKETYLSSMQYFSGLDKDHESLKYDALSGLSIVYESLGEIENSLEIQLEIREYYIKNKKHIDWIIQNLNIASDYINMKEYNEALFFIEEVEELITKTMVYSILFDAHSRLADMYEAMGEKDKAISHLRKALKQMDNSVNQDYKTAELEVRYEMAKNREKLEQEKAKNLENELALTKSRNEKERLRFFVIASLIVTIAVLIFVVWRVKIMKVIQRHKEQLHQQQLNKIRNEQELRALEAMLEGEEKERMRMSEELHDNLGSQLVGLKLQFGKLKKEAPNEEHPKFEAFDLQLTKAINESRAISKNLSTTLLTRFGLTSAVEDLIEHLKEVNDFKVSFVNKNIKRYESQTEVHLYRILQELLNNVVKHANASLVHISLLDENDELTLIVDDDGLGFDPNVMSRGIGIQNIRRRVGKLNGKIEIHSSPGKGTIVRVVVKTVGKKHK